MRTRLAQSLVVLATMMLILLTGAGAAAQDGALTVDPQTVAAGGTVTFSGSGCSAGAQVEYRALRGDINSPEIEILGDVEADADGNFSTSLVVPAGTSAGPLDIEARCGTSSDSSQTLSAQITVTAGELAVTGQHSAKLAATGLLAISVGAALLVVRRMVAD